MKILTVVIAVAIAVMPAASQTPASTSEFEAATIKRNNSVANGMNNRFGPELWSWTNVTLRTLVEQLYRIKDYQIEVAPAWMNADKWDVTAKTDSPTTSAQKEEMAKVLLAERFQLKFHWETRELPVYNLVALKGGPKFQQSKDDNVPAGLRVSTGLLNGHKWEVSSLANWLSAQLNMPVVDKAALKGIYDFTLKWSPVPNEGNFSTSNDAVPPPPPDQSGPTIFTALQEQLGLKLEKSKGPVQVLVVDFVARPSEN